MAEEQNLEQGMASDVQIQRKKRSKLVIVLFSMAVLLVSVLVMFLVANAVVSLRSGRLDEMRQETWAPSTEGKMEPLDTFAIPALQINLTDPTGSVPAFVRVTLALAYRDARAGSGSSENKGKIVSLVAEELDKRTYEIRDKIISIISSKSYEDLDSPDKQLLLKREIINQVNAVLLHGSIQDVYISDFSIVRTNY